MAVGALLAVMASPAISSGQVLPTVAVGADPAVASASYDCLTTMDITPGAFVFTRDETTGSLTVAYTVGGDATAGVDYEPLAGSVEFADGEDTTVVSVVPLERLLTLDTSEVSTVTVTIDPGAGFQVGADDAATVEVRQSRSGCDFFEPPVTDPAPVPVPTPVAPHFTG